MKTRDKYLNEGSWQPSPNLGLGLLAMMKGHISDLRTFKLLALKETADHFIYLSKYSDKDSAKKLKEAGKLINQAIEKIKGV